MSASTMKAKGTLTTLVYLERVYGWRPTREGTISTVGYCPIHTERTPSFHVYHRDGHYRCYGCGANGDVYGLMCELEFGGNRTRETWCEVFARARELGDVQPEPVMRQRFLAPAAAPLVPNEEERALLHAALSWWHAQLLSPRLGSPARAYLRARGIDPEWVERWCPTIGYAPSYQGQALRAALSSACPWATEEQLVRCGIVTARGTPRMWQRLMVGCEDHAGEPWCFQGRAISGEATAKYLNPPTFRRLPFTLWDLPTPPLLPGTMIVESFFGVLALGMVGIRAVAQLGPTHELIPFLRTLPPPFYLAHDTDMPRLRQGVLYCPGEEQAQAAKEACEQEGWPTIRVRPPAQYKDIDGWFRAEKGQALDRILTQIG